MSAQIIEEQVPSATAEQVPATGHAQRRGVWQRVRRTVAEMNYASRRSVELQAPWIDGHQPRHARHG